VTLSFHPYADLFPLIEGQEFYELAEDIRANGLHDRIDLIEVDGSRQILDGRNRYRALVWIMSTGEALGPGWGIHAGRPLSAADLMSEDQPWRSWLYLDGDADDYGDDLLAYVLSKNLHRRQLDDDERRMVGARLVTLKQGRPGQTSQIANISREQAAEIMQSDVAGIDRARSVIARAMPDIVQAVDQRRLSVAAAAEIAAQPAERQAEIVAKLPRDAEGKLTPEVKKALGPVIREIRKEKVAAKKERRAEREAETGRKIQALPDKMFGVAIEDFEWDHEPWSRETGTERHPSMHYETAEDAHTPDEIVARCAERFACLADDCILFKWTTGPHAWIAMQVMALQGFKYVSQLVWNKERPGEARGPGYWVTGEHEIVLIGVRGKVVAPFPAHFRSNFSAPVGDHSEKPDNIHEIIEFHWPNTPKVEFNARRRRPGWEAWGWDAPATQSVVGAVTGAVPSSSPAREVLDAEEARIIARLDLAERLDREAARLRSVASNSEIADDGEMPSAVDTPAPPVEPPPADGTVEPAPVVPHDRTETAVPPAGRPGPDFAPGAHPLDIPDFLRRTPKLVQAEMDLTRRDRAPAEIVDGALQTRLPLTDDELGMQQALLAIDAGEHVETGMIRHLIGAGFAHATTKHLLVTDEGRAFLAQLVPQVAAANAEVRA
jgi:N6-adenosine-specific RNA methylase IME4